MPFDATNYEPSDVGAERLRILADFLPTVPTDRFDLSLWSCGSVACAVGWAATVPALRAQGLRMVNRTPVFGELEAWDAVEAFFGISADDSERLFFDGTYSPEPTTADVAARIRKHIARRAAIASKAA